MRRRCDWARLNPLAVLRKRFAAARLVFNLGITTPSSCELSLDLALGVQAPWGGTTLSRALLTFCVGPTSSSARTSSPSAALPSAGSARSAHTAPDPPTPVAGARGRLPDVPFRGRGTSWSPWPCRLPAGSGSGYATSPDSRPLPFRGETSLP